MDKGAVTGAVLGVIGGAIASLVGAGVLFPPIAWSPTLTKSATGLAELKLSEARFDREVLIQVKAEAVASRPKDNRMRVEITANGERCNIPSDIYRNPETPPLLTAEDFCSIMLPKNRQLILKAEAPNNGADAKVIVVSVQTKNVSRSLW